MSASVIQHLFIPGLLEPLSAWQRDFKFVPEAPLLTRYLASCTRSQQDISGWLQGAYALLPAACGGLSHARNSLLYAFGGAVVIPETHSVLCATPIELEAGMSDIVVGASAIDDLNANDNQQLASLLNQHFSRDGWEFLVAADGHWFLLLPEADRPRFTIPVHAALGMSLRALVEDVEEVQWSKRLTELQMLLYTAPLNQQRAARQQRPISSFWLWDIVAPATPATNPAVDFIAGGGHAGQVMAHAAGLEWMDRVQDVQQNRPGLLIYEALEAAARENNLARWQEKLATLEAWLTPWLDEPGIKLVIHTDKGYIWQKSRYFWQRLRGKLPLAGKKTLLDWA